MNPSHPITAQRRLLYTRETICEGYARDDGLVDIDARMRDISPEGTVLPFHAEAAGEAIHDMRMTMTLDASMVTSASKPAPSMARHPIAPRSTRAMAR